MSSSGLDIEQKLLAARNFLFSRQLKTQFTYPLTGRSQSTNMTVGPGSKLDSNLFAILRFTWNSAEVDF
jgi:hypothetical protein